MRLNPNITTSETENGGIGLDMETGDYLRLNQSSYRIATLLSQRHAYGDFDLKDLANILCEKWDFDKETAASEAKAICKTFREGGVFID